MQPYQEQFIEFAVDLGVLQFGQFELKSGRISPYFFNAGKFNNGTALKRLGEFYAAALMDSGLPYDVLFGPAYKGIPLVAATAIALSDRGVDVPYVFNRKEAKDHGEGGQLVGADLKGQAVIVDDVITAGTAIREVIELFQHFPAEAAGVVVAIDREEKGTGDRSAIQEISAEFSLQVVSVVKLSHIVSYLENSGKNSETLAQMRAYQDTYGV